MELTLADVRAWLAEDLGDGDLTSEAVVAAGVRCDAAILLKEPGVVCGLGVAESVFRELDERLDWHATVSDGDRLDGGELVRLHGDARAILSGERLALNVLGRLSGIASLTRRYVDAVAGTGAVVLDTRKTTPGLRSLEKEAVRAGGGSNHRHGLFDAILIKDNHLAVAGSIRHAVRAATGRGVPVEVECETLAQVEEALAAGADRILLDNMSPAQLAEAVAVTADRAELEASGGVTLDTVRAVAETGVDFISIGALTHSARALDVSLEVLP
jgi:nicotinate-nucleotide pyrophosphorylase (carboxylating)